jgi:integrase
MGKRRQHGEGTITQRKDGRWAGAISVRKPDGTNGRVWVYGKTAQEVREKLRAKQREIDNGVNLFSDNPTVAQFLATWLEYTVKPARTAKTHATYVNLVKNQINPHLGKVKIKSLKPDHVRRMVAELQQGDYASRTINLALTALKSALKNAVASGELSRNVASGITVKIEKHEITPLTADQAKRFLEYVRGHRNYALYYLALSLGLRRGELLALRWADISLDKRTLTVRKSKTKSGIRTLTLPPHIVDVLQAHWQFQATERVLRSANWQEHGLVFPNERGKPFDPQGLTSHFKRALERSGLPDVCFHNLRHTAATLMIEQGVHMKVVQEILGHATLAMTADIYAHVSTDAVEDALGRVQLG